MLRNALTMLIASTLLAGCNQPDGRESRAEQSADGNMAGMQEMQGMNMGASGDMMQQMHAHMQMMKGAQGDSLRSMAAMHRPMAGNMLAQMNREMQQMNMAADPQWDALSDSVRQDLIRMNEWSMQDMQADMPEHMGRMRRLMDMHAAMMKH